MKIACQKGRGVVILLRYQEKIRGCRAPCARLFVEGGVQMLKRVVVVGGGAAGMLAAGTAAGRGLQVTVVEHSQRTCKKILVTGKGRCNVTNNCTPDEVLKNVRSNPKFLYSSMEAFSPADTMALMESLGVPLKTERGRRVFPVSDRAADIAAALQRYAGDCRVVFAQAKTVETAQGAVCGVRLADGHPYVFL